MVNFQGRVKIIKLNKWGFLFVGLFCFFLIQRHFSMAELGQRDF